jgi:hypothetical protein
MIKGMFFPCIDNVPVLLEVDNHTFLPIFSSIDKLHIAADVFSFENASIKSIENVDDFEKSVIESRKGFDDFDVILDPHIEDGRTQFNLVKF